MKTLSPLSRRYQLSPGVRRLSEFEIQAWLYSQLCELGLEVYGEVPWRNPETRETCRFDLVIFTDGILTEIIEVKADAVQHRSCVEDTRQGRRYRHFGVPVTFVYGITDAEEFVRLKAGVSDSEAA